MLTTYTWSQFQSVAQLSVGLNATFATIATFLGEDLRREEREIRYWIRRLAGAAVLPEVKKRELPTATTTLRLLSGKLQSLQRLYDQVIDRVLRPLCIVGLCAGFATLVHSSFAYNSCMDSLSVAVVLLSTAPFLSGFLFSLAMSGWAYMVCTRKRIKLIAVWGGNVG